MIQFTWKGVPVTATLTPAGWVGPIDCPLGQFATESDAVARLGGELVADPATPAAETDAETRKDGE